MAAFLIASVIKLGLNSATGAKDDDNWFDAQRALAIIASLGIGFIACRDFLEWREQRNLRLIRRREKAQKNEQRMKRLGRGGESSNDSGVKQFDDNFLMAWLGLSCLASSSNRSSFFLVQLHPSVSAFLLSR